VVVIAGDGGTVDIGLQSLSGAMERNENILYICYDNEAYMNTGVQGSSSTPLAASTTTTPAGKPVNNKDLMQIVMAHHVPYAASASIANLPDLRRKVQRAKEIKGCRVLHIMSPCPTGWGYKSAKTVEVAREAINCGAWVLLEFENDKLKLGRKPVELGQPQKYLSLQKRFRGASAEAVEKLGEHLTERYEYLEKLAQI
jgi:pyruvate/2-oxoacid:ferredoxin oxidoreductase beta subunit